MLKEIPKPSQPAEGPRRRVFRSVDIDLVVWVDDEGYYTGFAALEIRRRLLASHGGRRRRPGRAA
jgi:hypothetical protein